MHDLKAEIAHCVWGVKSPLIFNIAMTVLDEHLMAPWRPGGDMSTGNRRTSTTSRVILPSGPR